MPPTCLQKTRCRVVLGGASGSYSAGAPGALGGLTQGALRDPLRGSTSAY